MLYLWLSHNRIILRYSTFSYTYDYKNISLGGESGLLGITWKNVPFSVSSPYESKLGSEWKGIFLSKALVCPLCHYMRKKLFAALMLFCCCPNKFSTRASSLPLSPLQALIDYAYLPKFQHSFVGCSLKSRTNFSLSLLDTLGHTMRMHDSLIRAFEVGLMIQL